MGGHRRDYYDYSLSNVAALQFCKQVPTFQVKVWPPSQGLAVHTDNILGVLAPEDGGSMLLQNVGNYFPVNMA